MLAAEEEEWEARQRRLNGEDGDKESMSSFEEYREKGKAAGVM